MKKLLLALCVVLAPATALAKKDPELSPILKCKLPPKYDNVYGRLRVQCVEDAENKVLACGFVGYQGDKLCFSIDASTNCGEMKTAKITCGVILLFRPEEVPEEKEL